MALSLTKGAAKKKATPQFTGNAISTRAATVLTYLGPALIAILLINVLPIAYTVYMSFTDRNGPRRFPDGKYQVVGLDNYVRLLTDPDFYNVFLKTIIYVVVCVAFFFVTGLIVALALNHRVVKAKFAWRVAMILPWAVPTWLTALIWKFLFHSQYGPINQALAMVGITGPDWLLQPFTAFVAITIVNIWMSFPFFTLILLGGLQSIPSDVYEASSMDGAGFWRQLFEITLPMLRPVAVPAIILSAITTFAMFNTVKLMTDGGPYTSVAQPGATELLMLWAMNIGLGVRRLIGVSGALSVVMFTVMLILTVLATRATRATRSVQE
jgi:arabinogalactan oligomer/maltooligosaccharide transport system permease protein